ncbi:hypothetical protein ACA910_003654 [Epithemia clementina (nom. ined.)]
MPWSIFAPPDPVVDDVDNDNQPAVVAAPPIVAAEVEPNPQPPQAEVDEIIDLMDDGLFENIWNQGEDDFMVEVEEEINEDEENQNVESAVRLEEKRRREEHLRQPDEMRFG